MLRVAVLLGLCGCDVLFQLNQVPAPEPADAAPIDSAIPGLVAYYPMDDLGPDATCMTDAIGGPAGRCHGRPTLVTSIHGHAYQFDGSAYIEVPGAPEDPPTAPFTVTVWLQVVQPLTINYECPVNRVYGGANANSWQFCVFTGNVYFGGGDGSYAADGSSLVQGSWHQLALTFDGTQIQGFIDGRAQQLSPAQIFFDAQPLVIGVDLDAGISSAPYYQQIDELAIYDRVLTPTELAMLYQM